MQPRTITRILAGFIAMAAVVAIGTAGYWILGEGRWAAYDCLYMTMITVTTVGYGETLPGMDVVPHARTFTILLLFFGTGVLVYFASTVTAFIIEGDLSTLLLDKKNRKRMAKMKEHTLVCGAGSTGRHIIEELLRTNAAVVAIDTNEARLTELRDAFPGRPLSYIVGDATDDHNLERAGLASAKGVVAALSSDKDNLYITVAARQSSPQVRIIARASELAHVERLRRAGADSVVSPNFIGGMRMVSELLRPTVVKFLDDMLRDERAVVRIEEVVIGPHSAGVGQALTELDVLARFGMNVVAVQAAAANEGAAAPAVSAKSPAAAWQYNPPPSYRLQGGDTLVVIGTPDQVRRMRAELAT